MAEDLLTQRCLRRIIGQARLQRLIRAGWLKPAQRSSSRVFFSPRDVRAALTRLERERCPADKLEVLRVRASELRNGYPRVRKEKPPKPDLSAIELDFSAIPEVYD